MIVKKDLKDLRYYLGVCRNSHIAIWSKEENSFYYTRYKLGKFFTESIKHPEDDDGFDLFIPYELLPSPFEKDWKYDSRTASLLIKKNK